jgi:hypothetical protein
MAALGSAHLAAIPAPDSRLAFLQQMLAFARHEYLLLADRALPMWAKLLQDAAQSVSNAAASAAGGGGDGASPRQPTLALPTECVAALMDMAAEQLQVRQLHGDQRFGSLVGISKLGRGPPAIVPAVAHANPALVRHWVFWQPRGS